MLLAPVIPVMRFVSFWAKGGSANWYWKSMCEMVMGGVLGGEMVGVFVDAEDDLEAELVLRG